MQTVELNKKSKLAEFSHALSSAGDDLGRYPALKKHAAAFNSLAHDLLLPPIVVVMGAFNAGKSTLLNAMLGRNLLNMHVLPATATVTMLRKGNPGIFYGHTDGQPVRTWPASDLISLSAEGDATAADIRRSLSYIEVPLDLPLLDKVTLVDTPGLNSPNEAHTRATEDFVHRSQAILWIVSCLQPLNEQERSWIERLPEGVKVMVVVNQIDQLDPEEDSLPRVIERIQNNLQRRDLTVTAVSAKLALESRLKAYPNAYAASLWDRFIADFDNQIIQSDSGPQLQLALSKAAALVEALDKDIAKHLAEADSIRITAEVGNRYHGDLQERISALAETEHSLLHAPNASAVVRTFEIPGGCNVPENLQLRREVLISAIIALAAEQSTLDHEAAMFNDRLQACKADFRQWDSEVEIYKASRLYEGKPSFYGKSKLESRRKRLAARDWELRTEQNQFGAKQGALATRQNRVTSDCNVFITEIVVTVRDAMSAAVKESHDTVGHQKIAAQKLGELKWLPAFALETRQKPCWTLKGWGDTAESEEPARMYLCSSLHRLSETNDRILAESWSLSIPQPLVEPDALKKEPPPERPSSTVRVEPRAISKSLWVLALLVVIGLIVLFSMQHASQPPVQQTKVEESLPKPSAGSVAVLPIDDQAAIHAALIAEGYVPDGGMTDIPGLGTGVTIHAQKVSCSEGKPPCEKLFFFAGSRAVWSEDLDSSDALTALNVSGPGQLDAQFKSLLPDGTEGSNLVRYTWDGEKLSRSEDASKSDEAAIGDPPPNQAVTVEPSKNTAEDVVLTAEDLNRQGVAYANARQYDLAISTFTRAIAINAGQAELYSNRGTAFDGKGDFRRAIQDYDEAIKRNGGYPEAYFNRGNAFAKLGDYPRALADYDEALRLKPTFTEAATQRRAVMLRQVPLSQSVQQAPTQTYTASAQRNAYTAPIERRPPSPFAPRSVQGASYDDALQAARSALEAKDFQGAYRFASQARALNPNGTPALELMQVALAKGIEPRQTEGAGLEAIKHGGKAVFELKQYVAASSALHSVRLVITAGSLEYVPEASSGFVAFTIPLASIKSVELGENVWNAHFLLVKYVESRDGKGKEIRRQISFADPSARLVTGWSNNPIHISSQRGVSWQIDLFSAIRNVILGAKGRP